MISICARGFLPKNPLDCPVDMIDHWGNIGETFNGWMMVGCIPIVAEVRVYLPIQIRLSDFLAGGTREKVGQCLINKIHG